MDPDDPFDQPAQAGAAANAPRAAVCQTHGLRFDPTVHDGCLRCRSEAAAAANAAAQPDPTSVEAHIVQSRVMASAWIAGMVLVIVVIVGRVGSHGGASASGPSLTDLGGLGKPPSTESDDSSVGKGVIDPEPWKGRITGMDTIMDSQYIPYRQIADATLNFATELAESGSTRAAGTRLIRMSQQLPADPEARRIMWRRFRDETFILAPWFHNGPPAHEDPPPPRDPKSE